MTSLVSWTFSLKSLIRAGRSLFVDVDSAPARAELIEPEGSVERRSEAEPLQELQAIRVRFGIEFTGMLPMDSGKNEKSSRGLVGCSSALTFLEEKRSIALGLAKRVSVLLGSG